MDDKTEIPTIPAVSVLSRDGSLLKDALLTNGFFTPTSETTLICTKREGVLWTEQTPGAIGNGFYSDALSTYKVEDLHVYERVGLGYNLLTPDNVSGTGLCYFASTGTRTNPTWVVWHGGNNIVRSHDRDSAHPIISQTVPGVVGTLQPGMAYLDGTFYVVDSAGNVFGSPLDDPSAPWNPLNIIVAQNEADPAVGIVRHLNYVVVFGRRTITRFYDAGLSPGSPLAQVIGAFRHTGCSGGNTIVRIADKVFWLGTDQFGYIRAYTFNGIEPTEISTPDVVRVLNTATGFCLAFAQSDRSYYMVQLPLGYLMFDTTNQFWSFWTFRKEINPTVVVTLTQNARDPHLYTTPNTFSAGNTTFVKIQVGTSGEQYVPVQHIDSGTLTLRFPNSTYGATVSATITDYTQTYDVRNWSSGTLQANDTSLGTLTVGLSTIKVYHDTFAYVAGTTTSPIEFRTRSQDNDRGSRVKKSVSYIDVIADASDSNLFVRISDNDYTTYSGWRYTALISTPRMWNWGSFRRRSYETCSLDDEPLRLTKIVEKVQG